MGLRMRGRTWHLRMHVPQRFATVEPRRDIWISLHTDSRALAEKKAIVVEQEQLNAWEARLRGDSDDAHETLAHAKALAQARGFRFLPAKSVAKLPTHEILERIEAVVDRMGRVDVQTAVGTLGLVQEGGMRLSDALDEYWTLSRDRMEKKSADQIRRARAPRQKAFANLIKVIGDKPLEAITVDDMLDFRDWWIEKIAAEKLNGATANKDFTHLKSTLTYVNKMRRLGLQLPLEELTIKASKPQQRKPYSSTWIRDVILAPGAMDKLNPQARAVVHVMVNTGLRPIEIVNLTSSEIHLDAAVPHLSIKPIGRELKSDNAERRVPLVGIALEAMRQYPNGVTRYRDKSTSLSSIVNKYMAKHGLHETAEHTLYGLRHAFEDRMLAAGFDGRIRSDLMGHALGRERYGDGASLEHVQALLRPISF